MGQEEQERSPIKACYQPGDYFAACSQDNFWDSWLNTREQYMVSALRIVQTLQRVPVCHKVSACLLRSKDHMTQQGYCNRPAAVAHRPCEAAQPYSFKHQEGRYAGSHQPLSLVQEVNRTCVLLFFFPERRQLLPCMLLAPDRGMAKRVTFSANTSFELDWIH